LGLNEPSVLITDEIAESGVNLLKKAGLKVSINLNLTPEQLKRELKDYDAIIVRGKTVLTKGIIQASKKLKVIGRAGVGLDNIDVDFARKQGIEVVNAAEAPTASVAELTIGLMIALLRGIPKADISMKRGSWIKKDLVGRTLRGKTLGVIGFGRIGKYVAHIAKAMGMEVLVTDPRPDEKEAARLGAKITPLDQLLEDSDVITLHVPLTPQTERMINHRAIERMKKKPFIINTSRGRVIDEEALAMALKQGIISGAALDVYEVEPPTNSELVRMPNVVCTPHIGGQTKEAQEAIGITIAKKVIDSLKRRQACTST
jgi:D-3-phosphoglycerate dehydrogenase